MNTPIFLLPLLAITGLSIGAVATQAQVYQSSNRIPVADNTLGTKVVGDNNFAISGGVTRGQNTFHSFQDFSVPTNGVATFANPAGNQSIITRVTGSLFSDINGTINTQGANFLLINPNGVVFGPGTQLNVGRVFAASTANGIDLADGAGRTLTFGVNGAGDGALLSIDPKVIFNVSRLNLGGSGEISNFGTLRVNNPGQYIGLLGGNVSLNGGRIISQAGGRVELGGLSATGSVGVGIEGTNLRLSYPQDVAKANVSLTNKAAISTVGTAGADISIKARNIEVLSGSIIANGMRSGIGAAGDLKLQATENINISGANTLIGNGVVSSGRGGNILVDADSINLQDSAVLGTNTDGKGSLGNIVVTAKKAVSIKGNSNLASFVNGGAEGNGGDINIVADSISLQDNSRIAAFLAGKGNNGNITIAAKDSVSLTNSGVANFVDAAGIGNGGSIKINSNNLSLIGGTVTTFTSAQGNLGNIALTAKNIVSSAQNTASATRFSLISSSVDNSGVGQGGDINIVADSLTLDRTLVSTSTAGNGNAGSVFVTVKDVAMLTGNSSLLSKVDQGGIGRGGDVNINAGSLSFDSGLAYTSTAGKGNAGSVFVTVKDVAMLTGKSFLSSTVDRGGIGKGGDVNINAGSLSFDDSSVLIFTNGRGNTGNIDIVARDNLSFAKSDLLINVGATAIGKGGDIKLSSGSLLLNGGSSIVNSTNGQGSAGNVNIASNNVVNIAEKSSISNLAQASSTGGSGAVNIDARSLSVDDSSINSITNGQGNTGNTTIVVEGSVSLANRSSIENIVNKDGTGNAGEINITAGSLMADESRILASTFGQGNASNVNLKIKDAFTLNRSTFFSDVAAGGMGNGGNIDVTAGSLSFSNASQIISSVRAALANEPAGRGNASNITVKVVGLANFDTSVGIASSGLFATTEIGTEGNGGNINLDAGSISLKDGAGIRATIAGTGNSGNVTITAKDKISFDSVAGVLSRVESSGIGNAGDIKISGSDISFKNGAGLTAETLGQGNAGNITVDATNSIFLSGEGNNTRITFLLDRGGIVTRSQSATGIAGDITITAPKITLDNGGLISAQSNFGGGGNITIGSKNATDLFFLRRGSQVATDAGVTAQQGGDGGNININANFIFAVPKENSDISANAAKGRGGNVNINSQGLFGIQQRSQPSSSSDITASSSFGQNGIVNINTPGIDPGKDTSELPSIPTDASRQITQTCNSSQVGNRFYVTGRGGHPATSEDSLTQEVVWLDPRNPKTQLRAKKTTIQQISKSPQPAVGWSFNDQGKVTLLTASNQGTVNLSQSACPTTITRLSQ